MSPDIPNPVTPAPVCPVPPARETVTVTTSPTACVTPPLCPEINVRFSRSNLPSAGIRTKLSSVVL